MCDGAAAACQILADDEVLTLRLAASGLVPAEVAARLGWPVSRARAALHGAVLALRASSRLEAIVLAQRHGLLALPQEVRPTGE